MEDLKKKRTLSFKIAKELEKTSWGKQLLGAFTQALKTRRGHLIERTKKQIERQEKRNKQLMFGGKLQSAWTYLTYLVMILAVLSIALPILTFNYIKSQVMNGDWVDVSNSTFSNLTSSEQPLSNLTQEVDFGAKEDL